MNKSLVLFDKNSNLQKNATVIVKFNFEGKDYLIYCVDENDQNSQIFVSRVILNSEGKYFIDSILADEKSKLNNIVYNIVILLPTDVQKGGSFDTLCTNLFEKFAVKLSLDVPTMETQEYYSNCSVAITSKVLVDSAVKLYMEKLNTTSGSEEVLVPTWTAPVEVTAPTPAPVPENIVAQSSVTPTVPVQEQVPVADLNLQSSTVVNANEPVVVPVAPVVEVVNQASVNTPVTENVAQPNPQAEKLVVISDPSLGINAQQPNAVQNKKAGFANTRYVVIGTCCLALAIGVVITAFILINNIQ